MGSPEMTLTWFKNHFPDAVSVMGEQALLRDFERNPRSPLISTKVCTTLWCLNDVLSDRFWPE
jgi:hypothetical protein